MWYALYYKQELAFKAKAETLKDFKKLFDKERGEIFARLGYKNKSRNFSRLFNERISVIIDEWTVAAYPNAKSIKKHIAPDRAKRKRLKKKPVLNYFYVFDTESTNVNNQYALTYLYGIRKYNYSYELNDDNIEDFAEDYHAFYSKTAIKDFTNFLFNLNQEALKEDSLIYIYVHNLNYDLFELIQNVFLNFTLSDDDISENLNDSIFRGSAVKPLRFRFKNLVFIDSLALTNKSLAKISQAHTVKKLVELKTYKEQYFFGSDLPPEELAYNKNDLDVTALGIMDAVRSCKTRFETFDDFCKSYVSTVTGISKYLNKHIFPTKEENDALIKEHTRNASFNLPVDGKKINVERLKFRQAVFIGGFTHSNPFYAYNTAHLNYQYCYISYDKKSHYPSTMTMRYFPYDFNEITGDLLTEVKEAHAENLKRIDFYNTSEFFKNMLSDKMRIKNGQIYNNYFSPLLYYFNAAVELSDVEIKLFNNNCMPFIAVSKTDLTTYQLLNTNDYLIDNGKVLKAKKLKINCTAIDLLTFEMFYTFKITGCEYLEGTHRNKYADRYIQNTLRYHLVNKIELTELRDGNKKIEQLRDFSGNPIYNENQINAFYSLDGAGRASFVAGDIQASKQNGINNQYGINVQKIVNDNITFNLKRYRFEKELDTIQGCNGLQTTRDYITGMYITAYARLDLAVMTYYLYENVPECDVVYWDTDSIKVRCKRRERNKIDAAFNLYNERINVIRDRCIKDNGELYNLGIWELDGVYQFFYSLGAKKYVYKPEGVDEIKVTNAGINKKRFSAYLTDVYLQNRKQKINRLHSFINMLDSAYHPNLTIGSDITGRKTIKYPHIREEYINTTLTDENGAEIVVKQYPTALITECDYLLNSLRAESIANKMHFEICVALQTQNKIKFHCNTSPAHIGIKTNIINTEKSDFIIDNDF